MIITATIFVEFLQVGIQLIPAAHDDLAFRLALLRGGKAEMFLQVVQVCTTNIGAMLGNRYNHLDQHLGPGLLQQLNQQIRLSFLYYYHLMIK